jgi:hypothetical protein
MTTNHTTESIRDYHREPVFSLDSHKVNARALRTALHSVDPARSTDSSRPVLCSFELTVSVVESGPDEGKTLVTAVATDSYRLARARVIVNEESVSGFRPFTLAFGDDMKLSQVPALKGPARIGDQEASRDLPATLTIDRDKSVSAAAVTLSYDGSTSSTWQAPGEYPQWRSLMPETYSVSAVESAGFNPDYLAGVAKCVTGARKAAGKGFGEHTPVKLSHFVDKLKPALWTWQASDSHMSVELEYLLMPVRMAD